MYITGNIGGGENFGIKKLMIKLTLFFEFVDDGFLNILYIVS